METPTYTKAQLKELLAPTEKKVKNKTEAELIQLLLDTLEADEKYFTVNFTLKELKTINEAFIEAYPEKKLKTLSALDAFTKRELAVEGGKEVIEEPKKKSNKGTSSKITSPEKEKSHKSSKHASREPSPTRKGKSSKPSSRTTSPEKEKKGKSSKHASREPSPTRKEKSHTSSRTASPEKQEEEEIQDLVTLNKIINTVNGKKKDAFTLVQLLELEEAEEVKNAENLKPKSLATLILPLFVKHLYERANDTNEDREVRRTIARALLDYYEKTYTEKTSLRQLLLYADAAIADEETERLAERVEAGEDIEDNFDENRPCFTDAPNAYPEEVLRNILRIRKVDPKKYNKLDKKGLCDLVMKGGKPMIEELPTPSREEEEEGEPLKKNKGKNTTEGSPKKRSKGSPKKNNDEPDEAQVEALIAAFDMEQEEKEKKIANR